MRGLLCRIKSIAQLIQYFVSQRDLVGGTDKHNIKKGDCLLVIVCHPAIQGILLLNMEAPFGSLLGFHST